MGISRPCISAPLEMNRNNSPGILPGWLSSGSLDTLPFKVQQLTPASAHDGIKIPFHQHHHPLQKDIQMLKELGVCDSKKLNDEKIMSIGPKLIKHFDFSKLTLTNQKYNSKVAAYSITNQNKLLGLTNLC